MMESSVPHVVRPEQEHEPCIYVRAELCAEAQEDLAVLVHFILLFHKSLNLSAPALLHEAVESSLLSHSGEPFEALLAFLETYTHKSQHDLLQALRDRNGAKHQLAYLRNLVDAHAHHPQLRSFLTSEDGKVLPSARLCTGITDSKGVQYTWLRGPDGCCSNRVLVDRPFSSTKVLRAAEIMHVVRKLDMSRTRADLLAASWLRERVDRAAARTKRAEVLEQQRVERERQMEEEKQKRMEREKKRMGWVGGGKVDVEVFGRGRRERKSVRYEEEEDEEAEEEEFIVQNEEEDSDDSDASQVGSESSEEEVIDEGRGYDSENDSGNDSVAMGSPIAVGRRRVHSNTRVTRARAKLLEKVEKKSKRVEKGVAKRPVRKCRRLVRLEDL